MKIDYDGYVFLTTTYEGRLPLLIATLSNVMTRVKGALFQVRWYEGNSVETEDKRIYAQVMLNMIAESTGNYLSIDTIEDISVAQSKHVQLHPSITHFINLDDDLIVSEQSLRILRGLHKSEVVTIGVVDPINVRGFKDFDTIKYEGIAEFTAVHPLGKAKHHSFKYASVIHGYKWISQLYCMRREIYDYGLLWNPVLAKFQQKGIRGYDIALENRMTELGITADLIVGCEALHIGLEHDYIGGPWTGAAAITKTVVETNSGFDTERD
jgi:hypothetical protein